MSHEAISDLDPQARFAAMPLDHVPNVAPLPHGSRILFSPNQTFAGRVDELLTLARTLATQRTTAIATGIGGIGKTTLANEFAHRYGQYFMGGVFWLSFASPDNVHAEIAACGAKRHLDLHPEFEKLNLVDQFGLVQKHWAESPPCLLIFDNCEADDLLKFVPPTGEARVLITSRRRQWNQTYGIQLIELGKLNRADSVAMLDKYRFKATADERAMLAATLDDLPLALHLAASYIANEPMTVDEYLAELAAVPVLEHESLKPSERGIYATFALSYDKLDANDAVDACAMQLLARAACFAHGEPLPSDLLKRTLEAEPKIMRKALARLTNALGLLEPDGDNLRLHRLLAHFVQQHPNDGTAQTAVEQMMMKVAYELNMTGIPSKLQPLQTHLRWITEQALKREDDDAATLANNLAFHLNALGEYAAARPLLERALAIRERVLGADHPDTATSLNNLAALLQNMGKYRAARTLYERALAIRETVLGTDHPQTAGSLNNLALLLNNMGEYAAARPLYERALAIRETVLGGNHPDTAQSLNNLAALLQNMGEYEAARPLYERALAIDEQVYGANHPEVATDLNNLAELLRNMGEYAAARPLYERALAINETVLGADHPDTALSLNNLAWLCYNEGDVAQAIVFMRRALAIRETVLGADHPYTKGSRESLEIFENVGE